jgi:tetratricopeptide (TPR) repeat protein
MIFLSSASDLEKERKIFPEIVRHVHTTKAAPLGFELYPTGWEQTLIGKGGPQSKINKDLEICDLIVILFWKKWGTMTRKYSSGVEEEYELARKLGKEIWIYFRDILQPEDSNLNEDINKVIAFKKSIQKGGEYVYCTYRDENDRKDRFELHLSKWIDNIFAKNLADEAMEYYTPELGGIGGDSLWRGKQAVNLKHLLLLKQRLDSFAQGELRISFNYFLLQYHLAVVYNDMGDNVKAKEPCEGSLDLCDRLTDQISDEWKCKALNRMHKIYRDLGELRLAEKYIRKAISLAEEKKLPLIRPVSLYIKQGRYEEAEQLVRNALEKAENEDIKATNLCWLGIINWKRGNYQHARKYFENSIELFLESGGTAFGTLRCCVYAFKFYRSLGDTKAQVDMYTLILKITRDTGIRGIDGIDIEKEVFRCVERVEPDGSH